MYVRGECASVQNSEWIERVTSVLKHSGGVFPVMEFFFFLVWFGLVWSERVGTIRLCTCYGNA